MLKCQITSKRFSGSYWCNEWVGEPPAPGGTEAHYVHYSKNDIGRYWRIMAPPPSDQEM